MHWIVLAVATLTALVLAAIFVAVAARVLSWIPAAPVRRWTVLLVGLAVGAVVLFAAYQFYLDTGPEWRKRSHVLKDLADTYAHTPTIVILCVVPALTAALSVAAMLGLGFWPQRETEYQPRAAKWRIIRLTVCFAALAAFLLFALFVQDVELRWRLRRAEAQAQEIADSMTPASVPAEQNAAVHYQRVVDMMDDVRSWTKDPKYQDLWRKVRLCDIDDPVVKEYFDRLTPMLDALRQAAALDKCRFDDSYEPLDPIDGLDARSKLVTAMILTQLHADYASCQQNAQEALANMRTIRKWQEHMRQDPRNLDVADFFQLERLMQKSVQHLATHCQTLPAEELKSFVAQPLAIDDIRLDAAKWQAALTQETLATTYDGSIYLRPDIEGGEVLESDEPQARNARAMTLATMRLLWARDDLKSAARRFPFLSDPALEYASALPYPGDVRPQGRIANLLIDIPYSTAFASSANAHRELTNIGIAAALFRQDHGQWPGSLAQLVPDYLGHEPDDPETSSPFGIKDLADGLIVYSTRHADLFDGFDDSDDWWREAADYERTALYLGRAYESLEAHRQD